MLALSFQKRSDHRRIYRVKELIEARALTGRFLKNCSRMQEAAYGNERENLPLV